ncbi:transposase [Atopobium sp. oral taxon 416]|uniref:transposase n=1 Tax=Atopobium sp. oral taxon 416 TaxID=712157 RepID=UPI001BA71822|nr:transposase [Atopobium sp. oral taxon 416]QUC04054.1 transposase [Atopobium sp. oral taxon 416]
MLRASKLESATGVIESGVEETLSCALFPPEHWRRIRTNNGIERLSRQIKRRTHAAMMLAAGRCKYVAEGGWGPRRYLDTDLLNGWDNREVLKKQQG